VKIRKKKSTFFNHQEKGKKLAPRKFGFIKSNNWDYPSDIYMVQQEILAHQKCPSVKESVFKNKMKVLKKLKKRIGLCKYFIFVLFYLGIFCPFPLTRDELYRCRAVLLTRPIPVLIISALYSLSSFRCRRAYIMQANSAE
jgi:hypothetical protein